MIVEAAKRLDSVREYYFSTKLAEIRAMNANGADVINLGIGNPDLLPPDPVVNALKTHLEEPDVHGYQSYKGIPELRDAISKWMKKVYDIKSDPEKEVLPLIGSKEGIFHISMAFLNPGDAVLVPNPGYPTYGSVSELIGAQVFHYNLDSSQNWNINFESLEQLPLDKIKLMWLNSPHMPTGTEYHREDVVRLIELAQKHRFLIVNDNPYSFILNDSPQSLLSIESAPEVLLELNSLSKSHHMPGWRIGWLTGSEAYINTVLKVKSNIDSGMFKATQLAAVQALQTESDWHKDQNEVYKKRRSLVWGLLENLGCSFSHDQNGMFVWARIPESEKDSISFSEYLLQEAKVFTPPGDIFGSAGKGFLRLSLCVPEERIMEARERIEGI
ncbi:MAG: aminotransferase class I/II-fold pyridoxal phosphate-dependent enzyme [Bacteroidota bacterium]